MKVAPPGVVLGESAVTTCGAGLGPVCGCASTGLQTPMNRRTQKKRMLRIIRGIISPQPPGLAGSFTANPVDKFISRRRVPHLLFRVDLWSVDENIQCTRGASTQPNWPTELAFEIVLEAQGLRLQITSKEATFDLDLHA